jgi:hypothetical protein
MMFGARLSGAFTAFSQHYRCYFDEDDYYDHCEHYADRGCVSFFFGACVHFFQCDFDFVYVCFDGGYVSV